MNIIVNVMIVNTMISCTNGEHAKKLVGFIKGCPTVSGAKCIDQNTFSLCDTDGFSANARYNCAIGSICSENSMEICKPLYKSVPISCEENCGKCHIKKRYACIGRTKFALCPNGIYPSGAMYSCAKNTVCSTIQDAMTEDQEYDAKLTEFCFDESVVKKPDCC